MKNQISKKQNSNKRLYLSKHKNHQPITRKHIQLQFKTCPISCRKNLIFDTCFTREGNFFQGGGGGCNFHIKNKLKFEIFDDKKSL